MSALAQGVIGVSGEERIKAYKSEQRLAVKLAEQVWIAGAWQLTIDHFRELRTQPFTDCETVSRCG